jgi:chromosome segregation ATPase
MGGMKRRIKRLEERIDTTEAERREHEEHRSRVAEHLRALAEEGPEITEEERAAEREWEKNHPFEARAQIQDLKDKLEAMRGPAKPRGRAESRWRRHAR